MRNAFVNAAIELAKADSSLFLITGDLGFGVLSGFMSAYPERFINAGICEQNMTSVAVGMALEGKTVFTYSIANFPTLRCLEQIRNDVAYHRANVKIVAVGAGLSYGALGMSHHATEDIAMMRALPGMVVFTPCDPMEAAAITRLAAKIDGPCYIRLGKGGEQDLRPSLSEVELGKACLIREGRDAAMLAVGAIAKEAVNAAERLADRGIHCAVYSFPTVKPLDRDVIIDLASRHKTIFTLEEHNVLGGFGGAVCEVVAGIRSRAVVFRLGLNDVFSSAVGSQDYLRGCYHIDAKSIEQRVISEMT